MGEVVKFILPFLSAPSNYADILKKLATLAFYETYFITLALRANTKIDTFFSGIELWGPIGKAIAIIPHYDVLNLSGLAIATAVAVLTHVPIP